MKPNEKLSELLKDVPNAEELLESLRGTKWALPKDTIEPDEMECLEEQEFFSLTMGWAMAKGLDIVPAYVFSSYVRYNTDMC